MMSPTGDRIVTARLHRSTVARIIGTRGFTMQRGDIVDYQLTATDVELIHYRREAFSFLDGNRVAEGDIVPMVVARMWSDACVNGQAILDGNDRLWVCSATLLDDGGDVPLFGHPTYVHAEDAPVASDGEVHMNSGGSLDVSCVPDIEGRDVK